MKYYYTFGTEGSGGYSEERSFVAPPVPGPKVTTKILAYGGEYMLSCPRRALMCHLLSLACVDLGHGSMDENEEIHDIEPPSLVTTKHLAADVENYDLVLHVGDLSYAEGFGGSVSSDIFFCFKIVCDPFFSGNTSSTKWNL